jgi:hypothetical protein
MASSRFAISIGQTLPLVGCALADRSARVDEAAAVETCDCRRAADRMTAR